MEIKVVLLLCLLGIQAVQCGSSSSSSLSSNYGFFNVKDYGAKGDGKTDDTKAFMDAWKEACGSRGPGRLLIPWGAYLVGPLEFRGPCKNVPTMHIQLIGILKAPRDMSKFGSLDTWVLFGWVDGLTLTGGGTFDGQGSSAWPLNKCTTNTKCKLLPTSVKFASLTNTMVRGISSLNSKFFHIAILDCKHFKASSIKITAPEDSPNTDGIHLEGNTDITISQSTIGTGDDCISVGPGNSLVSIDNVKCGPGHGISVGSLGKYVDEGDVDGLSVRDCSISNTMNGLRIKTWAGSPGESRARNMTFQNIIMNNVGNPIIIDQSYCPYSFCPDKAPSQVKLSDITFKNIRGTSKTEVAVKLECSKGHPCKEIILQDVHLEYNGGPAKASCVNVKATYSGTQIPPPCS
ncbi:hypothetical protein AMTRI_Chr13g91810 [Amborella trichopoda]